MDLSDAYANSAYIPNASDYLTRWSEKAAAFRDALADRAALGVPYGGSDRQVYDVFAPEGQAAGTVIFVHGGYWRAFDQRSWSHLAAGALSCGWRVAMPSYDLCPTVRISEITRQIGAAVETIARAYSGTLVLAGHSAGGHLVARMLDPAVLPETVGRRIVRVAPISPLSDLRPLMQTDLNADLNLDAKEAQAESPIFTRNRRPADVKIWVGADERPAFLDQTEWLAHAWRVEARIVPGRHHFDIVDGLEQDSSDLTRFLTAGDPIGA